MSQLAGLESVQLFLDRAAAAQPGFALTPENAPVIGRLCWRLDGIPLAIELAAARIKVLTPRQILDRLDDRFRLLSGGSRVAQPRQQTLGALIDWSYDLLSEPERILLRRLTVFVAGRTIAMAEAVCAGEGLDQRAIADLLSALVEKSLLLIESGPDGESRYTMLESVWDYGEARLEQHQETTRFRRRHLEFFTRFAELAEAELTGPNQKLWLERMSADHYNLTIALRFSAESSETVEQGLRLAGAISRYWEVRNYLTEGYERFQSLLAIAAPNLPHAIRAKAEYGAARLSWCQGRNEHARRRYRSAQFLFQSLGNEEFVGIIEALLGFVERDEGNPEAARAHFYRAAQLGEERQSNRVLATALNGLSGLAADEGDHVGAREGKERSLMLFRSLGDQWVVALITGSLGRVCFLAGDLVAARNCLREFLTLARELGNKWTMPIVIEMLADISAKENDTLKAVRLYGAATELREALALGFSVSELKDHELALSRLRGTLPSEAFEREWNEGRALGLQRAIELAV